MPVADPRSSIFAWVEAGALPVEAVPEALRLAGVTPSAGAWLRFLNRVAFGLGTLLVAAGVIHFVAFNWQALPRWGKFALVEAAIVVAIGVVWRAGCDNLVGRVALIAAALFTGALLALVGQVYQTGADAWQLFAVWAVAILPWAIAGRDPILWLLLLALVNVACGLYLATFRGAFSILFGNWGVWRALFAVNAIALLAWEILAAFGMREFATSWGNRVVATACGIAATALAVSAISLYRDGDDVALVVYAIWALVSFWAYRVRRVDLFVLAGLVLSLIVVIGAWSARSLLSDERAAGLFLIALVLIGCTTAGAWWLRRVAGTLQR